MASSVFGLHPLVSIHNCISVNGCVWYQAAWVVNSNEYPLFLRSLPLPVFYISCKLFDISIDKLESGQYLLVMRSFFSQNKFQALIQPYLVLQAIQPDTLTNHLCTR